MMKKTLQICFALLLVQCTTSEKRSQTHSDKGLWLGKVQMTNQTTGQRKWANVNWASDSSQSRMRVDVSAVFDVPVATFLINQDGAHLWLFTENKYYHSNDSQKLFKYLTKLSVDPKIFYSMLGRPSAPDSSWKCQDNQSLLACRSTQDKTKYSVQYETTDQRVIKIDKGSKALRIRLSRSKVQVKESLFKALSTSHFKTFEI